MNGPAVDASDVDPNLCQHGEATCQNCGRGLAHDEPCPDPVPPAAPFVGGEAPLPW